MELTRIIPRDAGGLGWDIAVPAAPDRYDGLTILRMVKLVNRRGRVRLFNMFAGEWSWFQPPSEKVAGVDDRLDFVVSALDEFDLHVSFSDPFEAKRFCVDLQALLSVKFVSASQAVLDEQANERQRRQLFADRHDRDDYPWRPIMRPKDCRPYEVGDRWIVLVNARGIAASTIDVWMRTHIRGIYWAASWHPGREPAVVKMATRYYRLRQVEWERLIDQARATGCLVILNFALKEDYSRFDVQYGPRQFLQSPRPERL